MSFVKQLALNRWSATVRSWGPLCILPRSRWAQARLPHPPSPLPQVRSCTLDTWLPGQVAFMAHTGNGIANSYWEARLAPEAAKPSFHNLAGGSSISICPLH